jgi:hypothetical protein
MSRAFLATLLQQQTRPLQRQPIIQSPNIKSGWNSSNANKQNFRFNICFLRLALRRHFMLFMYWNGIHNGMETYWGIRVP